MNIVHEIPDGSLDFPSTLKCILVINQAKNLCGAAQHVGLCVMKTVRIIGYETE
jgi:hypothetical protein